MTDSSDTVKDSSDTVKDFGDTVKNSSDTVKDSSEARYRTGDTSRDGGVGVAARDHAAMLQVADFLNLGDRWQHQKSSLLLFRIPSMFHNSTDTVNDSSYTVTSSCDTVKDSSDTVKGRCR